MALQRVFLGVPGGIRTHDLLIRSQTLYPAELRAHAVAVQRDIILIYHVVIVNKANGGPAVISEIGWRWMTQCETDIKNNS